jgi:hypothetical protein
MNRLSMGLVSVVGLITGCGAADDIDVAGGEGVEDVAVVEEAITRLRTDIGVIPNDNDDCPGERIGLALNNEDDDNQNKREGWIGATESGRNTTFWFCRVDGTQFRPVRSTDNNASTYAVLSLGDTCPLGSARARRYFDNEDDDDASRSGSDAMLPNEWMSENLMMHFCVFKPTATGSSTPFPSLGFSYGVFGGDTLPGVGDGDDGWVKTDDEDDDNNNHYYHCSGDCGARTFISLGSSSTWLFMARVR